MSSQGEYTLANLPPGTYDISVPAPFGAFTEAVYVPFVQKDVKVLAGQTLPFNIAMKLQGNLATLADNPVALLNGMRARTSAPTGPTPLGCRTASPTSRAFGSTTPPTSLPSRRRRSCRCSRGRGRSRRNGRTRGSLPPKVRCLPSGVIQILQPLPYSFVQSASMLVILQEYDFPGWHQVFLDGRPHPKNRKPTWLGHSRHLGRRYLQWSTPSASAINRR